MDSSVSSAVAGGFLKGLLMGLKAAWPLWVLIALIVLGKLAWRAYEMQRLARSGLDDIDRMDGKVFEKYLEAVFRKRGYKVLRTRYVGDYGADLVIEKDGLKTVVQAKRHKGKVGVKAVQEVVASKGYYDCDRAMVVTNSLYTDQARELAKANGVELWDRDDLIRELLAADAKHALQAEVQIPAVNTAGQSNHEDKAVCAVCGKAVSEKVKAYCLTHTERFKGQIYCYEHQKTIT